MEKRFSLGDLSSFLRGDCDEYQLADFLQTKNGAARRHYVFNGVQENSLNMNVELEKVNDAKENVPAKDLTFHNNSPTHAKNNTQQINAFKNIASPTVSPSARDEHISPNNALYDLRTKSASKLSSSSPKATHSINRRSISKSGGPLASDNLRRSSLRRLSKVGSGRRTLLKEFEASMDTQTFLPPIFSTPCATPGKTNREAAEINEIIADSSSTPNLTEAMDCSQSKTTEQGQEKLSQSSLHGGTVIQNTPTTSMHTVVNDASVVHIPETQEQQSILNATKIQASPPTTPKSTLRHMTTRQMATQTVTTHDETLVATAEPNEQKMQQNETNAIDISKKQASGTDDIDSGTRLMVTEDEDDSIASSHSTVIQKSGVALNLASSKKKNTVRSRRYNKRQSTRRNTQLEQTSSVSTETESELGAPRAHATNLRNRNRTVTSMRSKIPLNKAPRTPINGEPFANEIKVYLSRLAKYNTLDLRKKRSLVAEAIPQAQLNEQPSNEPLCEPMDTNEELPFISPGNENVINLTPQKEVTITNPSETILMMNEAMDEQPTSTTEKQNNIVQQLEEVIPAPDAFRTPEAIVPEQQKILTSEPFTDELSSDRVSFVHPKERRKRQLKQPLPEVMKMYLDMSKKVNKKTRRPSTTKRSLYSKGYSDEEVTIDTDKFTQLDEIGFIPPPPPFAESSINNTQPQEQSDSSSAARKSTQSSSRKRNMRKSLMEKAITLESRQIDGIENEKVSSSTAEATTSEDVFKKPTRPAPISRPKKRKQSALESRETSQFTSQGKQTNELEQSLDESETDLGTTLRRSKRGRVPLKNTWTHISNDPTSIFTMLLSEQLNKGKQPQTKRKPKKKTPAVQNTQQFSLLGDTNTTETRSSVRMNYSPIIETIAESDLESHETNTLATPKPIKAIKVARPTTVAAVKRKNAKQPAKGTVAKLNRIFDELKNDVPPTSEPQSSNAIDSSNPPLRQLRVRVKRMRFSQTATGTTEIAEPTAVANITETPTNASSILQEAVKDSELVAWLKTISVGQMSAATEVFDNMCGTSANNLAFVSLEGIEYAFYNSDANVNMGYLRFQPKQIKPEKRAKMYNLHFIILCSEFKFIADKEERISYCGDMVTIKRGVRYLIENISDDVGLLLCFKSFEM